MAGPSGNPFFSATVKSGEVQLGPISGIREFNFWEGDPKQGDRPENAISVDQAYMRVPWLFRSVNLRANTIADIPWSILKGTSEIITSDRDEDRKLPPDLAWIKPATDKGSDPTQDTFTDLIKKTEIDLCLHAAAYWKRDANKVVTKSYRRFLPSTIRPLFDPEAGLTGFARTTAGASKPIHLTVDELVFMWLAGVDAEIGPGVAPAAVALRAAGLLSNIDTYGEGFFGRGAINATILSVEGNPQDSELRRLETWWKRLVGGVRRAFETVALKASIKPIIVGQPPKDLALDTLTEANRHAVATAMGVPMSLLDDKSANFATAKISLLNFLHLTIMPEAEHIEGNLNRQIFAPLGYEFRFHPEKLEPLQEEESTKSYKLLALVVGGVVTVNEMRDEMGFEAIDGGDILRLPPAPPNGTLDQPVPRSDSRMTNNVNGSLPRGSIGPGGSIPYSDRQVERQQVNQLGTTREGQNKALEILEMADVFAALAPQRPQPTRSVKRLEHNAEGRTVAVIEEHEYAEEAFSDEPYP